MKVKPVIIALILLGMYIVSTFAYAILQSIRSPVQLPKTNIVDYRLDSQLKNSFVQGGVTVLTFEYSSSCENCFEQKIFLEALANDFKQQLYTDIYNIYLEEILNETLESSKLTIESKLGNKTFTNPTENETVDAVCDLMFAPPVICAVR